MNLFSKHKKISKAPEVQKREAGGQVLKDWMLIIGAFVALVLIIATIDGYLLVKINRGDFFKVEENSELSQETVNRKKLVDVEEFFAARQKAYAEFSQTAAPEIDPSI